MKPSPESLIRFIDLAVNEDLLRYQSYVANLERLLLASIVEIDMSEKSAADFKKQLIEVSKTAQVLERSAINAQKSRVQEFAGVSEDESTGDMIAAMVAELKQSAVDQMVRDALAIQGNFQRIRTTAYLINEQRRMGESHAMRLAFFQNKPLFQHVFVDRAGRRWKAGTHVRTLFRAFYLEMVNDLEVAQLGRAGADKAALVYPDGRKIVFGIGGTVGLPSYAEVKGLHMHPNSSAIVRAETE